VAQTELFEACCQSSKIGVCVSEMVSLSPIPLLQCYKIIELLLPPSLL
jgi:hypothetical protein